jgi:hypothetical protein
MLRHTGRYGCETSNERWRHRKQQGERERDREKRRELKRCVRTKHTTTDRD